MTVELPFDRTKAILRLPKWYDPHYFRKTGRVFTPSNLLSILLIALGLFIVFSSTYVSLVVSLVQEARIGGLSVILTIELIIVIIVGYLFVSDYEKKRKAARITPYGYKLFGWLESTLIPFLEKEFNVYLDRADAEELIVHKSFVYQARKSSVLRIEYVDNKMLIMREMHQSVDEEDFALIPDIP